MDLDLEETLEWVSAFVADEQSPATTVAGYCVQLRTSPAQCFRVDANRVRRRFPPGSCVEIYKGEAEGWVKAFTPDQDERESSSVTCVGPQTALFESASQLWAQIQVEYADGFDTVINACWVRLCGDFGESEGTDDVVGLRDVESAFFSI